MDSDDQIGSSWQAGDEDTIFPSDQQISDQVKKTSQKRPQRGFGKNRQSGSGASRSRRSRSGNK